MKKYLSPQSVALSALAVGIAATALAWWLSASQAEAQDRAEFQNRAQLASQLFERRFQSYLDVLHGLNAFASHEPDLPRIEFHRYVTSLDVGARLPGVRALEFIRRVTEPRREAFVASVRADRSVDARG